MAISVNFNCKRDVFLALQRAPALRQEQKDEVLDALDATSHSPALTDQERKLFARCRSLLQLSWSGEWMFLQVVVLENIEVLKVEVLLQPRDEVTWQYAQSRAEDAAVLLQRAATVCQYIWPTINLGLPWASWLHIVGEVMSRESHFTLEPAAASVVEPEKQ